MSKVIRRTTRRRRESGSLQILEEAFHLLRSAGPASFWVYYRGAVPFALCSLYFVADMSRSSLARSDAAFVALVMTVIYFWMRYCQAEFCASLRGALSPEGKPFQGRRSRFFALAALFFLQALHLPILTAGAFFAIPLGWVIAMQQNFSALALTNEHRDRPLRDLLLKSIRFSHYEWAQNHGILLIFFFISLFTWINIVATCVLVPGFGKSFFGIENIFTLSPVAAVTNTTFIFGSFLLMQLVMTPLMLAAYTLRCFYADSRSSGSDLMSRLASCRERRKRGDRQEHSPGGDRPIVPARSPLMVLAVLSLATFGLAERHAFGEEVTSSAGIVVEEDPIGPEPFAREMAEQLRNGISGTLAQKKYQWQLSRRTFAGAAEEDRSWISQRLKEVAASAKKLVRAAGERFDEMIRRLTERNRPEGGSEINSDLRFFKGLSSGMSLAFVALILGLSGWLGLILYRKHAGRGKAESVSEGWRDGVIDLESEDIVATQLHEEEWMRLAREQIGKGDERLAVRALFLATLAHLGDRGLLKIARFKSNRDYRSELAMRARNLRELREAFDQNTTLFERVWYGMHQPGAGSVDYYLKNHEMISRESLKAAGGALSNAGREKGAW